MQKKLASELNDLAHSILRMRDKNDIIALKQKAYQVYEKLAVLAYVEHYLDTTPQVLETKEKLLERLGGLENSSVNISIKDVNNGVDESLSSELSVEDDLVGKEKIIEQDLQIEYELKEPLQIIDSFEEDEGKFDEVSYTEELKRPTLEEELKDTLSVDVTADLFTNIDSKKTLNDYLQKSIQIGLNDRIAFVKYLFEGDQNDFNRVISQLNTMDTENEAKKFIIKKVKPEYDWSDKEEYESRLMEIIARRFLK